MFEKVVGWYKMAFVLFKKAPSTLIFQTIFIFFVIIVGYLMKIFIISLFLSVIQTILIGGVFLSIAALNNNQKITFDNLFDGFSNNVAGLISLGLFYALIELLFSYFLFSIIKPNNSLVNFSHLNKNDYLILFGVALFNLAINFIFMLSVPFITLEKHNIVLAVAKSFRIFFNHLLIFIAYGIFYVIMAIVATIPVGLGWLLFFPVTIGSIYHIYIDYKT